MADDHLEETRPIFVRICLPQLARSGSLLFHDIAYTSWIDCAFPEAVGFSSAKVVRVGAQGRYLLKALYSLHGFLTAQSHITCCVRQLRLVVWSWLEQAVSVLNFLDEDDLLWDESDSLNPNPLPLRLCLRLRDLSPSSVLVRAPPPMHVFCELPSLLCL